MTNNIFLNGICRPWNIHAGTFLALSLRVLADAKGADSLSGWREKFSQFIPQRQSMAIDPNGIAHISVHGTLLKSLDKMWKAGNFEGVKKALESHPEKDSLPIFQYKKIFKAPIRNIHKSAIGKSGRVPKNWRTSYAVAGKGELKKYIRKVQLQVGVAKSGWLAALRKLGGKAPSFVNRHGTKYGGFIDGNKGDNPFFELINRVTTFPQGGTPMRILKRAFRVQAKAMENNIKRLMDKSGRIF